MAESRWIVALAICNILICTLGEGNLPPVFTQDMDNLALSESTPIGTLVYTLEGKDPENLPIKYGLVGTDKFSVNPDTGEVTLVQPLDREMESEFKLLVSIQDHVEGSSDNIVEVPVTVIVLDENDNPPIFKNSPYEIDVPEDEHVGSTVLQHILVEDRDSVGDNLEVGCVANLQWADACDIFEVVTIQSSSNQYSGALVLRKPLDYNIKQFYQFRLVATDGLLNGSAPVEVKVVDVQNSPPQFIGALTTALSEDAPVGTVALTVKARDADRAQPRAIYYELLTNPLDFFLLDRSTGELKTAKPLDREALQDPSSPLNLTVRASEIINGQPSISNITSTIATVTVSVKDVNDEPPRFNRREYRVEIPESLPIGTPLPNLDMVVTDTDVGSNSVFTLRVSDSLGAFIVEPGQAAGSAPVTLRLNSSLDFEDPNQRKFILEVIAEELHTNPRLSSKASVTVSVLDVNDNAPTFESPVYSAKVSESATRGTPITTITALDRDTGRFGTEGIVYQLFGNGADLFSVDNRSGVISVAYCETPGSAPCLDIETRRDYFLHYKATDDDGAGQTTVVSLQISLEDANDNPPVFSTAVYRASVDEDATKFEPELQVQARDADISSDIRYSIVDPPNSGYWIDAVSGKLGLETGARADSDDNHDSLTILATDGVHNATCKVEISIRDVNNHSPIFERQNFNTSVAEDSPIGTEVLTVKATDLDSGVNADIKYSIQKGALDAFIVNNETGLITISSKLDYDKRNTYRIQVIAADFGTPSLTGTTEVTIHVINVNDKKPYFTPTTQRAEVSADAEIGTVIHTLVAIDPDITDNSQLRYQININKPIRAVDNNGKEVTEEGIFSAWFFVLSNGSVAVARQLQRGKAAVLTLPVIVTDASATTLQQAEGELIITIVDVNRHAPEFPQSRYLEIFPEEQLVGTVLGTYIASDPESPVAYTLIQPPSPYFYIDNQTGVVRSSQRIDFEKVQRIEFKLVATDSGVPQRNGSATVVVEVTNVNDEEPVFDSPQGYSGSLVENAEEGTLVISIHATDADSGEFGEIRYNLTGKHAGLFTVDPTTGEVRVARDVVVDREVTQELRMQAVASDGAHTTIVPVQIAVIDENDNPPMFSQKVYKSTIAENLPIHPPAAILQVLAEDKDQGINARVQYKIIDQTEPGTFTVDESTGIIYPAKEVVGNTTHHLTVTATDEFGKGNHFDTAKVDISVLSVNKHSPVFVIPAPTQRVIEIPENAAQADFLVVTVNATDEDTGDNGRVSYYLKVDNQNVLETTHFSINPVTGELRTKTFLDREDSPTYLLVLVAVDNGTPAQFETLHFLTVLLQDFNDNLPRFPKERYEFLILENQPIGIIVGTVKAIDKDTDDNGRIYYHIVEGNQEGAFTLDRTQGYLRANISFDREVQSEYSLTIYASNDPVIERPAEILNSVDRDNNSLTEEHSIAYVVVKILDENDNEPIFDNKVYYASIRSTAKINEPVLTVNAVDGDFGENGTLSYVIAASNLYKFGDQTSSGSIVPSPFNVTVEGVVRTAAYMSEYNQDRFVLDIIAQEVALPHRRASTQLYVWIVDRSQTLRTVVSRPCARVASTLPTVCTRLASASGVRLVPGSLTHYIRADTLYEDWCEVHLLPVDQNTHQVLPVEKVLESIDNKYDDLKDMYQNYGIETVIAASAATRAPEGFDPALAALIALLIVLFTGIVTFIVVCSCLKHWVIAPPSLESSKGDSLSRRRILEELSTTENPLWLESKLRPYEEQELTMHVFGDQNEQQSNVEPAPTDNTYATIQTNRGTEPISEYATLSRDHDPLEAALGFQGSTFKPPTPETPEPPPRPTAGLSHLSCLQGRGLKLEGEEGSLRTRCLVDGGWWGERYSLVSLAPPASRPPSLCPSVRRAPRAAPSAAGCAACIRSPLRTRDSRLSTIFSNARMFMAFIVLVGAVLAAAVVHSDGSVVWSTGGKGVLTCDVSAQPTIRRPPPPLESTDQRPTRQRSPYLWRRVGEQFSSKKVSLNGTLEVSRRRDGASEGEYQCALRTNVGLVLAVPVLLKFAYIEKHFTTPPTNITTSVGQSALMTCQIGSGPPAEITWVKDGDILTNSTRLYFLQTGLLILDVNNEDEGQYKCIATNILLNKTRTSVSAHLSIEDPVNQEPTFLLEQSSYNLTADLGTTVVLPCPVAGHPRPEIIWEFTQLGSDRVLELDSTEQVLLRSQLSLDQEGVYTCRVVGHADLYKIFMLTLRGSLNITHPPNSQALPRAGTVRFGCTATGHPEPRVTWYKDGNITNFGGRVRNLKATNYDRMELVIGSVTSGDAGVYQCFVESAGRTLTAWASLNVTGSGAPAPAAVRCKPKDARHVTLSWTHPQHHSVLVYTVHTTPANDSGQTLPRMPHTNQSETVQLDSALAEYKFQVRAYFKISNMSFASDMSQSVVCQGQGVPIQLLKLDKDKVLISWQKFYKEVPKVQEWIVQLKPENSTEVINVTLDGPTTNYTVKLMPDSNLLVRVLGSLTKKWLQQDLSELAWINTKYAGNQTYYWEVPPAPTSVELLRVTSHGVSVRWSGVPAGPRAYLVCVAPSVRRRTNTTCVETTKPTAEINGLSPDTEYEIKVQAWGERPGAFSEPYPVLTLPEESHRFTKISYHHVNMTTVRVRWEVADSGLLDQYGVHYSSKLTLPVEEWRSLNVTGDSVLLTDLDPLANIYVMVTAYLPTEHSRVINIPPHVKDTGSELVWSRSDSELVVQWSDGAVVGCIARHSQNITHPIELWAVDNFTGQSVTIPISDPSLSTFVSVRCTDRETRMLTVPPEQQHSSPFFLAIIVGCSVCVLLLMVACVVLFVTKWRKRVRSPQRARRRHVSGDECNEEGSELKQMTVGSLSNGGAGGANRPLLNGHVHITENPALSKAPNGKVKKSRKFVAAFDVSRGDDPDVTLQTTLDESANCNFLLDTSRSDSPGKLPDDNMNEVISQRYKQRDTSKALPTLQPNG